MLRFLVLLLLLANAAYFAWTEGHLALFGLVPSVQNEPARLEAQINPKAVRLLTSAELRRLEAGAVVPPPVPLCLQSPLLDSRAVLAVQAAAQALPAGSWVLESASESARWIIYMGKFASADAATKKKQELRQLNIVFETLNSAALEPGISLGGYETQAEATQELAVLSKQGVRTAKVVQEKPAQQGQILRLPSVDEALRSKLDGVKTALGGSALKVCKS